MRSILNLKKNKKGQLDPGITTWLIVVVMIFVLGPVILKIVRGILVPTTDAFTNSNNTAMQKGGEQMTTGLNTFLTFWDGLLLFGFVASTILLFISAFLVDAHPIFIGFYIILLFSIIIFAPNFLQAVDNIYNANAFAGEVSYLPFLDFLRSNFGIILTVIGALTLLIMYAKYRYSTT